MNKEANYFLLKIVEDYEDEFQYEKYEYITHIKVEDYNEVWQEDTPYFSQPSSISNLNSLLHAKISGFLNSVILNCRLPVMKTPNRLVEVPEESKLKAKIYK